MEKTINLTKKEKILIIKALKTEVKAKVKKAREALARIDEQLASDSEQTILKE